jgi:hypothetical protein
VYPRRVAFGGVRLGEEERRPTFLSKDNEVCLAWLAEALQRLHQEGQEKAVGYLEAVLEEVVFETKMPPRPSGLSFGTEGP